MTYHTSWKANLNAKETLSSSLQARKPVIKAIHDPERSLHAPTVSERKLRSNSVTTGFNVDVARVDQYREIATSLGSVSSSDNSNLQTTAPSETADHIARKRVAENLSRKEPAKKRRKTRTCQKCGCEGCPGRKSSTHCRAACHDCGKRECKGRNSKRPNVPCCRAWD
jgi:septal ring-binding cell division protein DamX